ncbi:MAG: hypothetical protein E6K16_06595 [Methanobacteriota archaeon]|nr:MAG: hypothetical protein E6K16_06595 [Euryarchaeota archaeon]
MIPPSPLGLRDSPPFTVYMGIRFSRRAVLLTLAFGLMAIIGMAGFAALLTGSYEILALAPLSLFLWLLVFVWIAARLAGREREREG